MPCLITLLQYDNIGNKYEHRSSSEMGIFLEDLTTINDRNKKPIETFELGLAGKIKYDVC